MKLHKIASDYQLGQLVCNHSFNFTELYTIKHSQLIMSSDEFDDQYDSIYQFRPNALYYDLTPESSNGSIYCFMTDDCEVYAVSVLSGDQVFEHTLYKLISSGMSMYDAISVISI
jgi:hypothetical protein